MTAHHANMHPFTGFLMDRELEGRRGWSRIWRYLALEAADEFVFLGFTGPLLRRRLAVHADHPDFDEAWLEAAR